MDSTKEDIKCLVKESYAQAAKSSQCESSGGCCGGFIAPSEIFELGKTLDYTEDQLAIGLGEANLGLGCGNPLAMADLQCGETVLDLGSGAGYDAFLAAKNIGPTGKVIGVDMTPEMIQRANENMNKLKIANVEFRLGEIEELPVSDDSVDVVLSNCVINLSPDKEAVYRDMFRVLKPGGRISISDVLTSGEIPKEVKEDPSAYTG